MRAKIFMTILRKFWEGWKRVGQFIGDVLGRLILTLFYFTLVLPFGMIMRFTRDPLRLRRTGPPAWCARTPEETTIEAARRLS
jgi:hypothetical protein